MIKIEGKIATYQYNNQERIGQGSYGIVYKGKVVSVKVQQLNNKSLKEGQTVAIKRLRGGLSDLKKQDNNLRKIEYNRQKKILNQMSKAISAYIIQQFESFQQNDRYYTIMEYSEKGSLEELIKRHKKQNKKIPQEKIFKFLVSIVNGVHFMHNKVYKICNDSQQGDQKIGIMHRDLKPANILIFDNESHCKLIDFGFAKKTRFLNQEKIHTFCGTAPYESPQVIARKSYCAKSDVWSIGIILWEMLMLARPFAPRSTKKEIIQKQKQLFKTNFSEQTELGFIQVIKSQLGPNAQTWIKILRRTLEYQQQPRISSKQLIDMLNQKDIYSHFKKQEMTSQITFQSTQNVQRKRDKNFESPQSKIRREETSKMIIRYFEQKNDALDTRQQLTKQILRILCLSQFLDQHQRNIQAVYKNKYINVINKAKQYIVSIRQSQRSKQLGNRFWESLQCVIPSFNFESGQYNRNKLRQAIKQTLDHFQVEVAEEKQLSDLFIILKFQIEVTNQQLQGIPDKNEWIQYIQQIQTQLISKYGYQNIFESQSYDQNL